MAEQGNQNVSEKSIKIKLGTIIAIIVFIGGLLFSYASFKSDVQNNVNSLEERCRENRQTIKEVKKAQEKYLVQVTKISEQLKNIQEDIKEIKGEDYDSGECFQEKPKNST